MGSTNKTANLGLSQFIGTDKPTWLVDYNNDMAVIDEAIGELQNDSGLTDTAIAELQTNVQNLQNGQGGSATEIAEVKSDVQTLSANYETMHHEVVLLDNNVKSHDNIIAEIGTILTSMQDNKVTIPVDSYTELCRITNVPAGTYIAIATAVIPAGYTGMFRMTIGDETTELGRLTGLALQITQGAHTQFPEAMRIFTLNNAEDVLLRVLQISTDSSEIEVSGALRLIKIK